VTTRFVKGKARTESPRLKDNSVQITERDPSVGRVEAGRFGAGNTIATGRGWKAQIRKMLGTDASNEDVKQVLALYLALLRSLPADGPSVRQLAAAQARHAWFATQFTNLARDAGVGSPDGRRYADASRSHDLAAQRLAVTVFDLASREAAARPRDTFNPLAMSAEDRAAIVLPPPVRALLTGGSV
jgi:hypothetical protein